MIALLWQHRTPAVLASIVALGLSYPPPSLSADPDESALMLADSALAVAEKSSDLRAFVESEYAGATQRDGKASSYGRRLSLDVQYDHSFSPEWRAVIADRLDANWPKQGSDQNVINTIKEAYISWHAQPDTILDLGRINVRSGVAIGYNPTDFFRGGALRSVVSINPANLKENRQGSVVFRVQKLWDDGSLTGIYSPRLSDHASRKAFNPDWSATNRQERWLISVSQKINDNFNPLFLLYQEEHLPLQFGLNLTALANDATVVYAEWSGGRSPSLLAQAMQQAAPAVPVNTAYFNRLASGITYTTRNKISLTAELQYNGRGMGKEEWDALQHGPLASYSLYRSWAQLVQDMPTRKMIFFYATWQDALVNNLALSAMRSADIIDSSLRSWLEARYQIGHVDYVVQWQRNGGQRFSNFGAVPQMQSWQVSLRYYF